MTHRVFGLDAILGDDIAIHPFVVTTYYPEYLLSALKSNPDEFSNDVLRSFAEDLKSPHLSSVQLARAAREILVSRYANFANELLADRIGVTEDTEELRTVVKNYGFSQDLNELLSHVRHAIQNVDSEFDYAAIQKHLRTFFEHLHIEIAQKLSSNSRGSQRAARINRFPQALQWLQDNSVLPRELHVLSQALYGMLSEDVHNFRTKREYARMCYVMCIEFGVILLFKFDEQIKHDQS